VWELPPEPQPAPDLELATVLATRNPVVLAMAKSLLESAEIEYVTIGEQLQTIMPGLHMWGAPVRVQVRQEDEDDARECLSDLQEGA
jgi:hypothetical protein